MAEKIVLYLTFITNLFICSGVVRHWNNMPHQNNKVLENVIKEPEEEYQSLSENSQGSSDCEEIVIDIQEGWNIFGYTSSQVIEIGEVMAPYDDKIYIIKDNNGSQYWPANNYNGIGDFIPGGGYQIKAYESFSISF